MFRNKTPAISLLLLLTLTMTEDSLASKAGAQDRAGLIQRMERACAARLDDRGPDASPLNHPKAAICECIAKNLAANSTLEELDLLTRSHELNRSAERQLQQERFTALIELDDLTVNSCMESPDWTHSPQQATR